MFEDGDRVLDAVGLAMAVAVVAGLALVAFGVVSLSPTADAPAANFTFERVNGSHVRVTHDGGEAVRADRLIVSVDGVRRATDWEGAVTRGDATLVLAAPETTVTVYWNGGRADKRVVARWRA